MKTHQAVSFIEYVSARPRGIVGRLVLGMRWVILALLLLVTALWEAGAIWFDAPFQQANPGVAALFLIALIFLMWRVRSLAYKLTAWGIISCCVLALWFMQKPRNDRDWQPDVAETAWAEIKGDEVTLHNVRNSSYRNATDYTPRWETRTVHLSSITEMDLAICYWGSPWMAHPIVSFQFKDSPPLCISIETRKERGESYSALGGLYRQFELIYVVADEQDTLRLRTTIRTGEDVYLYRTTATPEQARERFLEYLAILQQLREQPRWYNAVTTNCTTAIRAQRDAGKRMPWDWRMLINGKGDELLFERGLIKTAGFSFADLRRRARINDDANSEALAPDFSRRIRINRPGCNPSITSAQ